MVISYVFNGYKDKIVIILNIYKKELSPFKNLMTSKIMQCSGTISFEFIDYLYDYISCKANSQYKSITTCKSSTTFLANYAQHVPLIACHSTNFKPLNASYPCHLHLISFYFFCNHSMCRVSSSFYKNVF